MHGGRFERRTIGQVLAEAAKLKEASQTGFAREDVPQGLGAWSSMKATPQNIEQLLRTRPDIAEFFKKPAPRAR